ncbi:phage head-binding domain-containing protein [Escherichia coli]|uniref:phage head-binding domain-containing protein n=1 Tax=Escherichia coli TaxID=562 RepID=UPI00209B6D5C|nr:phage head-binding domain-containing protein [Escherichia coli]
MTDITANVVVSMPSQLFTMARSFKAVANGKIYIGKIDTDPVNPENQIQVYVENEDGSHVPVSQPIIINAAGYPVYNGQIAKFVTVQGHSMAVYDAYGSQQFYFPNVLKYDPDQYGPDFKDQLAQTGVYADDNTKGDNLVGVKQPFTGSILRTQHQKNQEIISVSDFGAIGDGTLHKLSEKFNTIEEAKLLYPFVTSLNQSIDYAAVQQGINTATTLGRRLFIPAGKYYSSTPITITVENLYNKIGLEMFGEGSAISSIIFPEGSDGFKIVPATPGEYTYNVSLRDFGIIQDGPDDCSVGTAGIGIQAHNGCGYMLWDKLRIFKFHTGIKFYDAVFLSRFTAINITVCHDGFIMGSMGTSIYMDTMHVFGSIGTSYKLTAVYSTIGTLTNDKCQGTAYHFDFFQGTVGALGFETAEFDITGPIVKITNSQVQIGVVYLYKLSTATTLSYVFEFGGSSVDISKVHIEDPTPKAQTGLFYKTYQSHVRFKDIKSDDTFDFIEPSIDSDLSSSFVEFDGVKQTHGGVRPYIGSFGDTGQQIAQNFKDYTPPAFLFDCFGGFILAGANGGKNLGYATGPRLGMWGIERRPDLHGVAAYVSTSDSVDNNSATYATVPAILFTSTRPTNPVTGTHWSDPTTKKILYYAYGQWQDYMGNIVP